MISREINLVLFFKEVTWTRLVLRIEERSERMFVIAHPMISLFSSCRRNEKIFKSKLRGNKIRKLARRCVFSLWVGAIRLLCIECYLNASYFFCFLPFLPYHKTNILDWNINFFETKRISSFSSRVEFKNSTMMITSS